MSTTPAFSPGPWITHGAFAGSVRRWIFEDLYEQCSFHMAEKMPSSVKVGVRPINLTMRAYSSGLRPCSAISSGVMAGSFEATALNTFDVTVTAALVPAIHVSCPACKVADAKHKGGHNVARQAAF